MVHNEIIHSATMHYLEHKHGVKGAYSARRWIKKHGYPEKVINAIRELIKRLDKFRPLPSDALIALTCRHHGIDTILTFDEDFKRVPWLKAVP